VRGLYTRDEHHRLTAALNARVPTRRHTQLFGSIGNQVFRRSNHDRQAIWIHVPKNAGTSLRTALGFDNAGHVPIARYAAQDSVAASNYFKFAIVRNPWDRLYSSFTYLRRHKKGASFPDAIYADRYLRSYDSFEKFVMSLVDLQTRQRLLDYTHLLPQCYWLTLPGQARPYMDYIGRFENLSAAYAELSDRFAISASLPAKNVGKEGAYLDQYTDEMREIVGSVFRCDVETFGYAFGGAAK
jgi:hypothetical protein